MSFSSWDLYSITLQMGLRGSFLVVDALNWFTVWSLKNYSSGTSNITLTVYWQSGRPLRYPGKYFLQQFIVENYTITQKLLCVLPINGLSSSVILKRKNMWLAFYKKYKSSEVKFWCYLTKTFISTRKNLAQRQTWLLPPTPRLTVQ